MSQVKDRSNFPFWTRALFAAAAWAAVIGPATSFVGPPCAPTPPGLLAWLPAEGNFSDLSGNGNNGAPVGGVGFAPGEVGQAFSLGAGTYVSLGNPASLQLTGSFTFDAWVNPTDFGDTELHEILSKWGQNFGSCGPGTGADSFIFALIKSGGVIGVQAYIHLPSGGEPSIAGGSVPAGVFSHVAETYNSSTGFFALYVNGAQVASATLGASNICTSDVPVQIGFEVTSPQRFFPGLIDEVDIFNRALSQAEIQTIFNAGTTGKCPPGPCDVFVAQNPSVNVITGTSGNDNLTGLPNVKNAIFGFGGNDILTAGNMGDCVDGGEGNDHLIGGNGADLLVGGNGSDWLEGRGGSDTLIGGAGTDRLDGGPGSDVCTDTSPPANQFLNCELVGSDTDGDGVPDNIDQCPGTPQGVPVGPNGCPINNNS